MTLIDRNSKLPLYHQLYEILRENITRGEWQPGDMIPPEPELIDRYKVSRTTVRQVLDMLVNEDLIYRQQGRGTFVAHPSLEQMLVRSRRTTGSVWTTWLRGWRSGQITILRRRSRSSARRSSHARTLCYPRSGTA